MGSSAVRWMILLALVAAGVAIVLMARREPLRDAARLVWVADAHQLGPVGYRDPAGALSPDGRWIAYSEGRFLRVRPAGGGPIVELPPGEAQIRNVAWSPDSRMIVADGFQSQTGWALYDRVAGSRRALWSDHDPLSATLGEKSALMTTARVADLRQPAWSPAGRFIAAIVSGREAQELWTVSVDGQSARAQRFAHRIAFPAWTPRGEIACVATIDGRSRVTVPCGGTAVRTDPDLDVYGPIAFSPDGATVYVALASRRRSI